MRRATILLLIGLPVALGGWWFSTLPKASTEPESLPPVTKDLPPGPSLAASEIPRPVQARGSFDYDSREVHRAMGSLKKVVRPGGYVVDAWRFPDCQVVTVFYLPFDKIEEAGWFWFDLHEEEFTSVLRLPSLLSTLSGHIPDIRPPRYLDVSIVHTTEEPRYQVARAGARGEFDVEVRFAADACESLPSEVFLFDPRNTVPVPVDLAEEIRAVLGRP